jgi:hypothetical protein
VREGEAILDIKVELKLREEEKILISPYLTKEKVIP